MKNQSAAYPVIHRTVSHHSIDSILTAMATADEDHCTNIALNLVMHHRHLINQGRTSDGMTALVLAAQKGYSLTVQLLRQNGASLNTYTSNGTSALMAAAMNGHTTTVQLLIDWDRLQINQHRTSDGATPLILATQQGHIDTVGLLLRRGAHVNQRCFLHENTALMIAINSGHLNIAEQLLFHGANTSYVNRYCNTALLLAAQKGYTSTVHLLITCNRHQINQPRAHDGDTPLILATQYGHIHTVALLLQKGADVNQCCTLYGNTALMAALISGHHDIAALLLNHDADDSHVNRYGESAMAIFDRMNRSPIPPSRYPISPAPLQPMRDFPPTQATVMRTHSSPIPRCTTPTVSLSHDKSRLHNTEEEVQVLAPQGTTSPTSCTKSSPRDETPTTVVLSSTPTLNPTSPPPLRDLPPQCTTSPPILSEGIPQGNTGHRPPLLLRIGSISPRSSIILRPPQGNVGPSFQSLVDVAEAASDQPSKRPRR